MAVVSKIEVRERPRTLSAEALARGEVVFPLAGDVACEGCGALLDARGSVVAVSGGRAVACGNCDARYPIGHSGAPEPSETETVLAVLEANASRCLDDEGDRRAVAAAIVAAIEEARRG